MRLFKLFLLAILITFPGLIEAQIPGPQIALGGNIGCAGFPCLNNGTLIMAADANRTMTAQETSALYIKVTSSVSLTATRNLIAPAGRFPFTIENATTGGQSIQIIGVSGTGVTIANGAAVSVWNDGTNFVQIGTSSGSGITALTGDVTASGTGSVAATVVQVEGAAIPASAAILGTNSSKQLISTTASQVNTLLATLSGCGTAGTVYAPVTGTCVANGGGSPASPNGSIQVNDTGSFGAATANQMGSALYNPVSGASAEYKIIDCTTTCPDSSGSGNAATPGTGANGPTIGSFGAYFYQANAQSIATPLQTFGTFIANYCTDFTQSTGTPPVSSYVDIFGATSGGIFLDNNFTFTTGHDILSLIPSIFDNVAGAFTTTSANAFGNCHTVAYSLATNDHVYIDGQEIAYTTQGATASHATTSGQYVIGCSAVGGSCPAANAFDGYINYVVVYPTALTQAQIQQEGNYISQQLALRPSYPKFPLSNTSRTSQAIFVGDSLTYGTYGSGQWENYLTLNNTYNVDNWGWVGIGAHDMCWTAQSRWIGSAAPSAQVNRAYIFSDNNDYPNSGLTAADTWASLASCGRKAIAAGIQPILVTPLSRNGQDTEQQQLAALERAGWKSAGYSALSDINEDPVLGCTSCYSNTTYFYTDGIHLTGGNACTLTTGYGRLCEAASSVINMLDGSTETTPTVQSGTTYTMLVSDRFLNWTPSGAATGTLPECNYLTGQTFSINNLSGTYTITMSGASSEAIIGSGAIAPNTVAQFVDQVVSTTAGGCEWIRNVAPPSLPLTGGTVTGNVSVSASTAATSSANANSPNMSFIGNRYNGSASVADPWNCYVNLSNWSGNPDTAPSYLECDYSGSASSYAFKVPNLFVGGESQLAALQIIQPSTTTPFVLATSGISVSGTNYSSPLAEIAGNIYGGSGNIADQYFWQDVVGPTATNPTSTLTLTKGTGTTGPSAVSFSTLPVQLPAYLVSALPSASTTGAGFAVEVKDATNTSTGTCTGSGTAGNYVIAVSNGTNWICP